jgi:hypothetical protein
MAGITAVMTVLYWPPNKGQIKASIPHSLQFHMWLTILSRTFCLPMMVDANPR